MHIWVHLPGGVVAARYEIQAVRLAMNRCRLDLLGAS